MTYNRANFAFSLSAVEEMELLRAESTKKMLEVARKIGAEKMAAREAYIAQYLEKSGHAIEDLELVQYTDFSEAGIAREICFLRLRGQT